jgi:hypothetical protein
MDGRPRPRMRRIRSPQQARKISTNPAHTPEAIARARSKTRRRMSTMGGFRRHIESAGRPRMYRIRGPQQTREISTNPARSPETIIRAGCKARRRLSTMGGCRRHVMSAWGTRIHRARSRQQTRRTSINLTHGPGTLTRAGCKAHRALSTMGGYRRHVTSAWGARIHRLRSLQQTRKISIDFTHSPETIIRAGCKAHRRLSRMEGCWRHARSARSSGQCLKRDDTPAWVLGLRASIKVSKSHHPGVIAWAVCNHCG